jgi:hypothetical protein
MTEKLTTIQNPKKVTKVITIKNESNHMIVLFNPDGNPVNFAPNDVLQITEEEYARIKKFYTEQQLPVYVSPQVIEDKDKKIEELQRELAKAKGLENAKEQSVKAKKSDERLALEAEYKELGKSLKGMHNVSDEALKEAIEQLKAESQE